MLPYRMMRFAPNNNIALQILFIIWRPGQCCAISQLFYQYLNTFGASGSVGNGSERCCIYPSDIGNIFEINKLWKIAVLNAVFNTNRLMLMRVHFVGLRKAYGCISFVYKG